MVSKQTGMIITGVMAVLFGCAGALSCMGAFLSMPFSSSLPYEVTSWFWVFANACTGIAFLSLPVVFYFLIVHNRPDDPLPPL